MVAMESPIQLPENKFGISGQLHDFSQAQYEVYQPVALKASRDAYFGFEGGAGLTANAIVRGATCRAAIDAKILTGITAEQVANMKPPAVAWLAEQIRKHVVAVTTPPPDPN